MEAITDSFLAKAACSPPNSGHGHTEFLGRNSIQSPLRANALETGSHGNLPSVRTPEHKPGKQTSHTIPEPESA